MSDQNTVMGRGDESEEAYPIDEVLHGIIYRYVKKCEEIGIQVPGEWHGIAPRPVRVIRRSLDVEDWEEVARNHEAGLSIVMQKEHGQIQRSKGVQTKELNEINSSPTAADDHAEMRRAIRDAVERMYKETGQSPLSLIERELSEEDIHNLVGFIAPRLYGAMEPQWSAFANDIKIFAAEHPDDDGGIPLWKRCADDIAQSIFAGDAPQSMAEQFGIICNTVVPRSPFAASYPALMVDRSIFERVMKESYREALRLFIETVLEEDQ